MRLFFVIMFSFSLFESKAQEYKVMFADYYMKLYNVNVHQHSFLNDTFFVSESGNVWDSIFDFKYFKPYISNQDSSFISKNEIKYYYNGELKTKISPKLFKEGKPTLFLRKIMEANSPYFLDIVLFFPYKDSLIEGQKYFIYKAITYDGYNNESYEYYYKKLLVNFDSKGLDNEQFWYAYFLPEKALLFFSSKDTVIKPKLIEAGMPSRELIDFARQW